MCNINKRNYVVAVFGALLLMLAGRPLHAQSAALATAEKKIEERIAASHADVGVAFRMLDGSAAWYYHEDEPFHAASTMKIPVMIELFHQQKEGKLKLSDPLLVKNEFHSIVDGSSFKLDAGDDSEAELYKAEGQTRTLGQLLELMITVSSNLATNLIIEKLGPQKIRNSVHALHANGMNFLRGVEDNKAFEKGLNNTTTARGLEVLLTAIAQGKAVNAGSSREMVEVLKRQKFNEGIPSGLPAGTVVAHKTGEITKIHHDAAIVYAPKPYVLVILTRGLEKQEESALLMGEISRLIYQAVEGAAK